MAKKGNTPQPNEGPPDRSGMDRRNFMRLGAAALVAGVLGAAETGKADYRPQDLPDDVKNAGTHLPVGAEIQENREMSPEEADKMQYAQEIVYKHYLSPPFIIYLRQIGLFEKVKKDLEPVMKYP